MFVVNVESKKDTTPSISLATNSEQAKLSNKINITWIERLFDVFNHNYPLLWRRALQETGETVEQAKQRWFNELANTTKPAFERAVETIRHHPDFAQYPPHLARMRALCRINPEDFGCPSEEEAFYLFSHGKQRKAAPVFHAANRIVHLAVRELPINKSKQAFLRVYRDIVDEIIKGNTDLLSIPTLAALPIKEKYPPKQFTKIRHASEHLQHMYKSLGIEHKEGRAC